MPRRPNPTPDISDVAMAPLKDAARKLCQSCTYETGQGACALICMEQRSPRSHPHGCSHALKVMTPILKKTLTRGGVMRLNAYLKSQSN